MHRTLKSLVSTTAALLFASLCAEAQLTFSGSFSYGGTFDGPHAVLPGGIPVYDNLSTTATVGYGEPNANNPIFGDQLTLTQGGTLGAIGLSLYNSATNGSINAGNFLVKFYNNTVPYSGSGPITGALLGSVNLSVTISGGLSPNFYATGAFDVSSLGINVPQNILITQQFTETSGTSTANGVIGFSNPVLGSSPQTVYISSSATPAALYFFGATPTSNPNQFGYYVELVPEPSSLTLLGAAFLGLFVARKRSARAA